MQTDKLWFDDEKIFIQTDDGRTLWQSLLWYPRLQKANTRQRENYEIDASGIHWPEIDEDVSLESFLYEDPEPTGISKLFRVHPELNVSAIARRMGMKQSLLAAYISGTKMPSPEREQEIRKVIKQIGNELISSLTA